MVSTKTWCQPTHGVNIVSTNVVSTNVVSTNVVSTNVVSTSLSFAAQLEVPLVSLFFCLKLPLLGAAPFRWSFVAGLVVIIGGLLTYNHKTLTTWRGSNAN
eukprot:Skav208188  [mRNA]  locus=scaffold2530:450939:451407:+ [translate_table: standard]